MTTDAMYRSASTDIRVRDILMARALAPALDSQLAAGCPPQSSRALALRSRQIVSPAARRALVRRWDHLLDQARRPAVLITSRAPLCRDQIAIAERDVREMLAVLACPFPVSPRGAAMASQLLSDGTGPLYNRRSSRSLREEVHTATSELVLSGSSPVATLGRESAACYR